MFGLKTMLVLFIGISLGGVDHSETRLRFHFEVNVRYYLVIYFFADFSHYSWCFLEEMADVNQSTVKTVNIHHSRIDVVKFDGTNNFSM